jgi:hypothetical protein
MEQLEALSNKVNHIESNVKEIKDALLGNEFNKEKGMISIIEDHEERIASLEKVKDRAMYWFMGACATSGIAMYKILESIVKP